MVNEKEDMLKVYRHEIPDGLPHLLSSGVHFLAPQNGFHERPAGGKGGTGTAPWNLQPASIWGHSTVSTACVHPGLTPRYLPPVSIGVYLRRVPLYRLKQPLHCSVIMFL